MMVVFKAVVLVLDGKKVDWSCQDTSFHCGWITGDLLSKLLPHFTTWRTVKHYV